MATNVDPIIGSWYQRVKGSEFEVVGFDEDDGVVEIQDSDGNLEEIDIDTWYSMELEDIDNPDDYAEESVDGDADYDELEYDDAELDDEDWDDS